MGDIKKDSIIESFFYIFNKADYLKSSAYLTNFNTLDLPSLEMALKI